MEKKVNRGILMKNKRKGNGKDKGGNGLKR